MAQYIIRRVLISIPVFFGITFLVYFGINSAPGDPIGNLIPFEQLAQATPAEVQAIRRSLGLDQPLPVRYGIWLREMLKGNMGRSFKNKAQVSELIVSRVGNTLRLSVASLLFALAVGITSGVLMALKQNTWVDYLLGVITLAQWSIPPFFVGLSAIYIFSIKLGWLPAFGMFTPGQQVSLVDQLRFIVMPATILGLYNSATYARYTRASVLDALRSEYVTTARAKGLHNRSVVIRHVFKNAALPIVTIVGLSMGNLLGGAVIVETIFAWPGMGKLGVQATIDRDYPTLMGVVTVGALMVLLSNLVTDIVYGWVDPRIHYT